MLPINVTLREVTFAGLSIIGTMLYEAKKQQKSKGIFQFNGKQVDIEVTKNIALFIFTL